MLLLLISQIETSVFAFNLRLFLLMLLGLLKNKLCFSRSQEMTFWTSVLVGVGATQDTASCMQPAENTIPEMKRSVIPFGSFI